MSKPTGTLWRVEFTQGYGMPEVYKRERTRRTYESAEDAGRMVATIRAWPSHHQLEAVWRGQVVWEPVDPDSLPVPMISDQSELTDERET